MLIMQYFLDDVIRPEVFSEVVPFAIEAYDRAFSADSKRLELANIPFVYDRIEEDRTAIHIAVDRDTRQQVDIPYIVYVVHTSKTMMEFDQELRSMFSEQPDFTNPFHCWALMSGLVESKPFGELHLTPKPGTLPQHAVLFVGRKTGEGLESVAVLEPVVVH